jgi:monoamine oxidase
VLLADSPGPRGRSAAERSAAERVARAVRDAAVAFPGVDVRAGAARSAAWPAAYVAWAPGQVTGFAWAVRRAHEHVHFAGEHTDAHATWMEGAVRSGRRAAREALQRLADER